MRVGLALPQYGIDFEGGLLAPEVLLAVAQAGEAAGLDSLWLSDHPFAIGPDGTVSGALEPLISLASLARATERVRLGTLVLSSTMRAPAMLAHAARTLSAAAPGRVTIGIGAGWYRPEHEAFGVELPAYEARASLAEAAAVAVRSLPVAPRVLVGGAGPAMLAVAARAADAWNVSWDVPAGRFAELSRALDDACALAGRDPRSVERTVGVTVLVGNDSRSLDRSVERLRARAPFLSSVARGALERRIVVGTPAECAERLSTYEADEVVVALLLRDDLELLALFAAEVAPLLRA